MQTPWNQSDQTESLAEGIDWVSTPTHGGIRVDKRNSEFLSEYSKQESIEDSNAYWFEEDSLYSICALDYLDFYDKPLLKDIDRPALVKTMFVYNSDWLNSDKKENEVDSQILKLDKKESKLIEWVNRAKSTDISRPALQSTNFNSEISAVDGWRHHKIDKLESIDLNGQFEMPKIRAGENIIEIEPMDSDYDYPDVEEAIYLQLNTKEPVLTIKMNPKLLMDALRGLKGMVKLTFYDSESPMIIEGELEDEDVTALIMAMRD